MRPSVIRSTFSAYFLAPISSQWPPAQGVAMLSSSLFCACATGAARPSPPATAKAAMKPLNPIIVSSFPSVLVCWQAQSSGPRPDRHQTGPNRIPCISIACASNRSAGRIDHPDIGRKRQCLRSLCHRAKRHPPVTRLIYRTPMRTRLSSSRTGNIQANPDPAPIPKPSRLVSSIFRPIHPAATFIYQRRIPSIRTAIAALVNDPDRGRLLLTSAPFAAQVGRSRL